MGEIGRRPGRAKKKGATHYASSLLLKKNQAPWPKTERQKEQEVTGNNTRGVYNFLFVARVRLFVS